MIKVAINGYGTIGKRVADAVAAQEDMEIIGVSKTRPSSEALVANKRGYPLYIADISKKPAFEAAGIKVAGTVEEMIAACDVVVDATPGGIGKNNRALYEKAGKKAIWQGGEDHEVAGFSFNKPDFDFFVLLNDTIGRIYIEKDACDYNWNDITLDDRIKILKYFKSFLTRWDLCGIDYDDIEMRLLCPKISELDYYIKKIKQIAAGLESPIDSDPDKISTHKEKMVRSLKNALAALEDYDNEFIETKVPFSGIDKSLMAILQSDES